MSRPGIHEIFSHKAMNKNSNFKHESLESRGNVNLTKKNVYAPAPPMLKFGGYKPKILSDENEFLTHVKTTRAPPPPPTAPPPRPPPPPPLPPQLTKPKPWVIGDKNIPMVLNIPEETNDNESSQFPSVNSNHISHRNNENSRYRSTQNFDSSFQTNLHQNGSGVTENHVNTPLLHDSLYSRNSNTEIDNNGYLSEPNMDIDSSVTVMQADTFPNYIEPEYASIGFEKPESHDLPDILEPDIEFFDISQVPEPEPEPDYEEDEKTLDFEAEEIYNMNKEARNHYLPREYAGEDYSKYIPDDEDEKSKSNTIKSYGQKYTKKAPKSLQNFDHKSLERHSLFKTNPQQKPNYKKKKSKSVQSFNSVRSFSYTDSKIGTQGRNSGKTIQTSTNGFSNGHHPENNYESFLRSRHSEMIALPESRNFFNDYNSSKHKDSSVWKKLTLRIKDKVRRGSSLKF